MHPLLEQLGEALAASMPEDVEAFVLDWLIYKEKGMSNPVSVMMSGILSISMFCFVSIFIGSSMVVLVGTTRYVVVGSSMVVARSRSDLFITRLLERV